MSQVSSRLGLIGLAAVAVLGPAAWAYVNGGDFHNTLAKYEQQLKGAGWVTSFAPALPGVPDKLDVGQLVGKALQALPEKEAARVTPEVKREVARLAREAMDSALSNKKQVIKEGKTGSLRYQVGMYAFERYWETNYGGKREIHARQTGLAPFVALKVERGEP